MKNKEHIKIDNIIYLIAYTIFIFVKNIQNSLYSEMINKSTYTILRYVILGLLILLFLNKIIKGIRINKLLNNILLILVGFLTYMYCGIADCFCVCLFIILATFIDHKLIIKTSVVVNLIMIFFIIISSLFGVIKDYTYVHNSLFGIIPAIGHSLGFKHYSNAQFLLLFTSIMIIYSHNTKKVRLSLLLLNILSFFVFTAKLPIIIFIIYLLLNKTLIYKPKIFNNSKWSFLPLVCIIISLVSCFIYSKDSTLMNSINSIFNNRLSEGHIALTTYGLKLFGQKLLVQGSYTLTYGSNVDWSLGYFFIDNDYLLMSIVYGIVFTIIILKMYYNFIRRTIDSGNEMLLIWIIITLIFAFVNSSLIAIEFNPLLLIFISMYGNYYDEKIRRIKNGICNN